MSFAIAWFNLGYMAVFWIFMGIRICSMWRQDVSVIDRTKKFQKVHEFANSFEAAWVLAYFILAD